MAKIWRRTRRRYYAARRSSRPKQEGSLVARVWGALGEKFEVIKFTRPQLQHAFKHAGDLGVIGNPSNTTLAEFSSALYNHVTALGTRAIQGTYRGEPVTHFVDPNTRLNVIRDASDNFLSGWKLNPKQLDHVLISGKLGGG